MQNMQFIWLILGIRIFVGINSTLLISLYMCFSFSCIYVFTALMYGCVNVQVCMHMYVYKCDVLYVSICVYSFIACYNTFLGKRSISDAFSSATPPYLIDIMSLN